MACAPHNSQLESPLGSRLLSCAEAKLAQARPPAADSRAPRLKQSTQRLIRAIVSFSRWRQLRNALAIKPLVYLKVAVQKMMLGMPSTSLGSHGFHFQTVGTGAKIFLRIGAAGLAVAKCTFGLAKERQRPLFDSTLIRRDAAQCRARGGTGAVAIAGRLQRVVAQGAAGELSGPGLYRFRCSQTWQVLDLLLGQNTSGCPETHARTSRDLN